MWQIHGFKPEVEDWLRANWFPKQYFDYAYHRMEAVGPYSSEEDERP